MNEKQVLPWARCSDCGKVVRVNKPILGSTHLCLSECERRGFHAGKRRRAGPPWARRNEIHCQDCTYAQLETW